MYALILSGPPGSGKTTYRKQYLPSEFIQLSLDDLVFREAARQEKTYEEVWPDYVGTAEDIFNEQLRQCNNRRLPCIIDKTHLDESSRKKTLAKLDKDIVRVGIYFPAYTPEVLDKRIKQRASEGGHSVPSEVLKSMHARYKLPQKTEGFDLVVSSSHFIDIMKVMEFK